MNNACCKKTSPDFADFVKGQNTLIREGNIKSNFNGYARCESCEK